MLFRSSVSQLVFQAVEVEIVVDLLVLAVVDVDLITSQLVFVDWLVVQLVLVL